MSKLSKREKWAKETGLKKEQYRQRKNLPFPVKNKEISVGDRPKGVSKREFWASKTGFTKEQYKQRASLPAIKPQPRRYGGGGALPSTSSGSPLVKYLSKFAKTAGEQIATGVKEVMGDASTSLRKKTEGYTPRELIKMRRDWRRSEEPIKKEQIGNITSEIKRIRQEKVVRQHQVIQKTQEQIQRERDDPIVKFGRFINEVQTDPIGTVKRVWSGEYDRPQVRPAPAYSPGKYERDQYTEAPRVDFRKSILGKYLGGAASEIINAPLQTATDIYNRAMKAKKAKESGSRLDFAIAEGRLGLAEINTIFTPISMLFNSAKELGMPEEFKMVNPIYKLAQEKITKMNLPPDLDKATRYVAGLMINPLDPKNMAEMAEMPIQLSGQAGAYVSNKALDVLPISPVNKEKLRPLFNEAGALIAQIGLFEAGIRGAKRATRPPEVRTTPKIPMADVTKGREKEVVLRPELMREGVKMEEIKRVPIKEAPKPEVKPKSVEEIVRESGMAKITKKERVTTPLGREAAGKARFDFKTNTGEVVFTPAKRKSQKRTNLATW